MKYGLIYCEYQISFILSNILLHMVLYYLENVILTFIVKYGCLNGGTM